MLQIDLGCGTNKQTSFIGVDRYALPGVDIIADMNAPLPFRDGSVDLLFASHSLEHVKTLLGAIKEVYRICKHGAQMCVLAPYSEQKLNLANPYHTCVFNEHTPRFWTDYPRTPIDPEEYNHPHATEWGLSSSDHSDPGIDIRLVRLEYFYFPQYAGLSPFEQRRLRHERVDVCDQILYHLIVWKGDGHSPGKSFDDYVAEFRPYEPEHISLLRNRGQGMLLQKSQAEEDARAGLAKELAALREAHASGRSESERLTTELIALKKSYADLQASETALTSQLAGAREDLTRLQKQWVDQTEVIGRGREILLQKSQAEEEARAGLAKELAALREAHASGRSESERLTTELIALKKSYADLQASETALTSQLGGAREDLTRLQKRWVDQTEAIGRMTTELHDTAAHNRSLRDDAARSERELEVARADLRRDSAAVAAAQEQASSLAGQVRELQAALESNNVLRAKLGLTQAELETTTALLGLERQKEMALDLAVAAAKKEMAAAAQDAERCNTLWGAAKRSLSAILAEARIPAPAHLVSVGGFLIGRQSQPQQLSEPLIPLREYSNRHFRAARACLVLSGDLSEVSYREYIIPLDLALLTSVSLAIRPLLTESAGFAGIEIVTGGSEVLAHVRSRLVGIRGDGTTEFKLPAPIAGLKKNWLLRVFVKETIAPVSVYELARGGLLRGGMQFFPLVFLK